jgi:hypothetical protein
LQKAHSAKSPPSLWAHSRGKAKDFYTIHFNQLTTSAPSFQNGTASQNNSYPAKIIFKKIIIIQETDL